MPEDDWTPVARSTREPVASIVLPDESFELEDLDELARALEEAGLPVLIAESPAQRRLIVSPQEVHVVIHVAKDVLTGVAASAAWEGVKAAFARLRRRGHRADASELTIYVEIRTDRLVASARGPATQALAEVAQAFVDRANHAGA